MSTCKNVYPWATDFDGLPFQCQLPAGHEGMHEDQDLDGDTVAWGAGHFSETDPDTWGELPAGYEWRSVSDEEEQLFAPDGRNLSAVLWDAR